MTRLLKAIALFAVFCAASTQAEDSIRILFIGNSYTGQIRKTVTQLIKTSPEGKATELEFITPGGKTLQFHLENPQTVQMISEGNWNFVVLQDQSQTPAVFPDQFNDAARELDKLIDAAGAKTVFYQTWGRRDGDKANRDRFPDYETMQKSLSKSYETTARRCRALLAPVGDVWAEVRKADSELGKELYKDDGSHPSAKGAYLAACVFYKTLFDKLPTLEFDDGITTEEKARILIAIDEVVEK